MCICAIWMALIARHGVRIAETAMEDLFALVHYRFKLEPQPAGIPNDPDNNQKHSIVTADANLPGWLPADDISFQGMAPAGAKFGYNLAKHPELASAFPPLPTLMAQQT